MQNWRAFTLPLFVLLWVGFSSVSTAEEIWRVMYDTHPFWSPGGKKIVKGSPEYKRRMALLEEVYDGKVYVIDPNSPPKAPLKVNGIVLHNDARPDGDKLWIIGDSNPELDYQPARRKAESLVPGVTNIEEKYDEYRVFSVLFPDIKPPEMKLGSDFIEAPTPTERENAEKAVKKQIADYEASGQNSLATQARKIQEELIKLEVIRIRILENPLMGRSILKVRYLNHSEGRLPKTTDNWIDTFARYSQKTRAEVKELKDVWGKDGIADAILGKPFVEGHVLEHFLNGESQDLIVQHMIKIKTEARLHVMNGKVFFKGDPTRRTTFLRHYSVNKYLADSEIALLENTLQQHLNGLAPELRKFHMTPDLVIEEGTNKIYILDGNIGVQSGYYDATEDLFTAALQTEFLTGRRSQFLKGWDSFKALPMGKQKSTALREIRKRYNLILRRDIKESFWDRVIEHYYHDIFQKDPTPEKVEAILQEFKNAGLNVESIYLQFLAQVQDQGIRLSPKAREKWAKYFNQLDPDLETRVTEDGRLEDFEIPDPALPCRVLKKINPNPNQ